MSALRIAGAWKSFRKKQVLRGLDLAVSPGEPYVLVGREGSGKTIALGAACGLVPLDAGEVRAGGRPLHESGARIGAIVGKAGVLSGMSVRDNLRAKAIALGVPDVRQRCDRLIAQMGLQDVASERAGRLSPGMAKWLAFALAFVGSPDVFLLDDPLTGVDSPGKAHLLQLLATLSEQGVAVLIATQEIAPFATLASRYGILSGGAVVREMAASQLDAACRSVVRVKTSCPERTLAQIEASFPAAPALFRGDGTIELPGVKIDEVSRALFALPERIVELSEQRRSADEIVAGITEGRRVEPS